MKNLFAHERDYLILVWVACLIVIAGCSSYTKSSSRSTSETADGVKTTIESRSYARQPMWPIQGAWSKAGTNGIAEASTSGSQDKAGIDREKWNGIGDIVIYLLCGVLAVFGGAVLWVGEKFGLTRKECNRDGIIIMGTGVGMFAVMKLLEASEPVMMWVVPALFIAVVVFFGVIYSKKAKTPKLQTPI